jgi:hypothetical protein
LLASSITSVRTTCPSTPAKDTAATSSHCRAEPPDLKYNLPWHVSQQAPTDDERVNNIDVTTMIEGSPRLIQTSFIHVKAFDLQAGKRSSFSIPPEFSDSARSCSYPAK